MKRERGSKPPSGLGNNPSTDDSVRARQRQVDSVTGAGLNESEEFLTAARRGGKDASGDFNVNVGYDVDSSGSARRLANYGEPKKTNSPDDAQTLAETRYSKYAQSAGKEAPPDQATARGSQGGAALLNEEARKSK